MIKRLAVLLAFAGVWLQGRADILPAENLLPKETVLVVSAPDWPKAWSFVTTSLYGRLWRDPALRPFKDKFIEKFTTNALEPLEQSLGIQLSDYQDLAQGQVTFALVPVGQKETEAFSQLLLIDTKSHASQLKTNLASISKKWIDAGKAIKTQKIREVEFTTLIISPSDLSLKKIFPQIQFAPAIGEDSKAPEKNVEITFGQIDSLLIAGDSPEAIEKVLSLQQGGLLAPLADEPSFQSDFGARLRGAPCYGWINIKTLMDVLGKASESDDDDSGLLKLPSLLNASGLGGVTSACLSLQDTPGGTVLQFFIGSDESKRAGFLRILAPEAKDANPPPFVPADAVKFWRWRVNIPNSWTKLETMLNEWNPQGSKALDFIFANAGKDKDEHYDLKSELLNNLGDDVISYQKAPGASSYADLDSPPSIYLIGSPNPDRLASALTVAMGMMGQGSGGVKEREFLGRKIHTVTLGAAENGPSPTVSYSASGGYVALAGNAAILEEYLRSNDSKAKTLMDSQNLGDAAQSVGGLSTGWFGYENQNQEMRPLFELLRRQRPAVSDFLGLSRVPGKPTYAEEVLGLLLDWSDFSLLPPYGAVSKYFNYSVYACRFTPEGFTMKMFAPTPPALR
jgi:hypothetical protein